MIAFSFANDTKTEFEKLKTLEGKWVGKMEPFTLKQTTIGVG